MTGDRKYLPASAKKYVARYKDEQDQISQRLRDELQKLRNEYGASMTELAEGLGISRQRLYNFMDQPEDGLSINRANILGLWACLTDVDTMPDKSLKPEEQEKRNELAKMGPSNLLLAAGFLPPSSSRSLDSQTLDIEHPQIRRVVSRLSSRWIADDIVRAKLADHFLEQILERGRLNRESYTDIIPNPEDWVTGEPLLSSEQTVILKYKSEIRRLANSGKTEFVAAELFELYQSILEHEILNRDFQEKLDVNDCQFRTISISIFGQDEILDEICKRAEKKLARLLSPSEVELDPQSTSPFPPMIEVTINVAFLDKQGDRKAATWWYGSTTTHIENMLIAIKTGLGYPMIVTDFSIRATGRNEKSLAKVSIALSNLEDSQQVYQGWWVGSNTILAILKSVVDAVKRWLSDRAIAVSEYYELCQELAEVDRNLYSGMQALYERAPYPKDSDIETSYIAKILEIQQRVSLPKLQSVNYLEKLCIQFNKKFLSTQLMQVHLSLISGDLYKARQHIQEAEAILEGAKKLQRELAAEVSDYSLLLLAIYASACVMFYKFLTGDREFLVGRLWRHRSRYKLEDRIRDLEPYVKANGVIDFEVYLYTSQIYGTVGYLEFYFCQQDDEKNLKDSVNYLLTAAHYSARIGHVRRAVYWLSYTSRVYTRLGGEENLHRAEKFIRISKSLLKNENSLRLTEPGEEKNWSMANIDLAQGELCLARGRFEEALKYFFHALDIALYTGFLRLIADSLYDIYRASQSPIQATLAPSNIIQQVSEFFLTSDEKQEPENKNLIVQTVTQDVTKLLSESDTKSWAEIGSACRKMAQTIWHYWASQREDFKEEDKHPIEEEIERDTFLNGLIRE